MKKLMMIAGIALTAALIGCQAPTDTTAQASPGALGTTSCSQSQTAATCGQAAAACAAACASQKDGAGSACCASNAETNASPGAVSDAPAECQGAKKKSCGGCPFSGGGN